MIVEADSKIQWLIRGILGVGSIRFLVVPVTLTTVIILARFLDPDAFGVYSYSMSLAELIALPVGVALRGLIIRTVAVAHSSNDFKLIDRVRSEALQVVFIYGALSIILGLTFICLGDSSSLALAAALCLAPIFALYEIYSGILQGLGQPILSQLPQLLIRPLFFLFMVTIAWYFNVLNLTVVFAIYAVTSVLVFVVLYTYVHSLLKYNFQAGSVISSDKNWKKSYLPFLSIELAHFLSLNLGIIILGMIGDNEGAAGMRITQSTGLILIFPIVAVEILIQPRLAQLSDLRDRIEFKTIYRTGARIATVMCLFMAIPLIFYVEVLISVTFGDNYAELVADPIRIIVVARVIQACMGASDKFLLMTRHERSVLFSQIIALAITLTLLVFLAPIMSTKGAAVAIALGLTSKVFIEACLVRQIFGQWFGIFMKTSDLPKKA
jgi:O-antigen/teichoic acid export membrane protein